MLSIVLGIYAYVIYGIEYLWQEVSMIQGIYVNLQYMVSMCMLSLEQSIYVYVFYGMDLISMVTTLILDLCMYLCIYINVIYSICYLCVCYLWSKASMCMLSMEQSIYVYVFYGMDLQ